MSNKLQLVRIITTAETFTVPLSVLENIGLLYDSYIEQGKKEGFYTTCKKNEIEQVLQPLLNASSKCPPEALFHYLVRPIAVMNVQSLIKYFHYINEKNGVGFRKIYTEQLAKRAQMRFLINANNLTRTSDYEYKLKLYKFETEIKSHSVTELRLNKIQTVEFEKHYADFYELKFNNFSIMYDIVKLDNDQINIIIEKLKNEKEENEKKLAIINSFK